MHQVNIYLWFVDEHTIPIYKPHIACAEGLHFICGLYSMLVWTCECIFCMQTKGKILNVCLKRRIVIYDLVALS